MSCVPSVATKGMMLSTLTMTALITPHSVPVRMATANRPMPETPMRKDTAIIIPQSAIRGICERSMLPVSSTMESPQAMIPV